MEKILVATDFSLSCEELLNYVADLGLAGIQEVVLVHVTEDLTSDGKIKDETMIQLNQLRASLEEKNFLVTICLRWGKAAQELAEVSRNEKADFIVAFSKGRQYFKRTFWGSTSMELVQIATCPVLIEKGELVAAPVGQSSHFRKVLVPTDFSLASLEALAVLKSMREYIQEVVFVHVIEDKKVDLKNEKAVEHLHLNLAELVEEMEGFGLKARYYLEAGTASKEIIELSKNINVSMLILPKVSGSLVRNILIGSTAQALAIGAEIPVMMVPADLTR